MDDPLLIYKQFLVHPSTLTSGCGSGVITTGLFTLLIPLNSDNVLLKCSPIEYFFSNS